MAYLTLSFLPIAERGALLVRLYGLLRPGGAMLIFDKSEPSSVAVFSAMERLRWSHKLLLDNTSAEVMDKELALQGVQRPLLATELPGQPQEVFRFGEFVGWLIVR